MLLSIVMVMVLVSCIASSERPRTAGGTLRHTLAADREPKDVGGTPSAPVSDTPFVLDAEGYGAKSLYYGAKSASTVAGEKEGAHCTALHHTAPQS